MKDYPNGPHGDTQQDARSCLSIIVAIMVAITIVILVMLITWPE